MSWVKEFEKVFETSVQPEALTQLKNKYITWVKQRGPYYSSLKDVCPEFLELLNAIENVIKVQVKIEPAKKDSNKDTKEKK